MPQLDPTWFLSQFFWLLVCFFSLYFAVSKFLIPKIAKVLELRQQKIDGYLAQAQSFKTEAEKSLAEYEKAIKKAKNKAEEQISKQQQDLQKLIEDKNQEVSNTIAEELKKTQASVDNAKNQLFEKVDDIAKNLSIEIIKKLDV